MSSSINKIFWRYGCITGKNKKKKFPDDSLILIPSWIREKIKLQNDSNNQMKHPNLNSEEQKEPDRYRYHCEAIVLSVHIRLLQILTPLNHPCFSSRLPRNRKKKIFWREKNRCEVKRAFKRYLRFDRRNRITQAMKRLPPFYPFIPSIISLECANKRSSCIPTNLKIILPSRVILNAHLESF